MPIALFGFVAEKKAQMQPFETIECYNVREDGLPTELWKTNQLIEIWMVAVNLNFGK